MGESIFVLDSNNKIIELKESKYSSEDIFQELIEKYPNILAGDQITPDNPRRWIFISREIGVPDKEDGSNARNIKKDNRTSEKPKYDFSCFA